MKVERTEITPRLNSYVSVIEREESFFQSPFHYHPELELVYVLESHGKRIIGNTVEPFDSGDMIFIGSNTPHVWLNDEIYYSGLDKLKAKAIVVYFNRDIFSDTFYALKEVKKIKDLFAGAVRGIKVTGKTHGLLDKKLRELAKKKDFEIIIGLLEVLSILADSKDLSFINKESYTPANTQLHNDRITEVLNYVKQHFKRDISLQEVSDLAHLTPQSFCRIFKKRMQKHFIEYLNEVRIAHACKLLLETDLSISEIAFESGYKTVSNFNKIFKKMTDASPLTYRKKIS